MSEDLTDYDLCVIGGGINGAGIARDAAGRGMSVLLVEQGDLAAATSAASTKLIHGGLRYLEHFEFNLVRHALQEREKLLDIAPHIISPLQFILPHDKNLRPAWMIRLGLFLYDHLARRDKLPGSKQVRLEESPLKDTYKKGFRYADCWVDDSRLVVLNALSAAEKGAHILTRTKCTSLNADEEKDLWTIGLEGRPPVTARAVINAGGPWVRSLLDANKLTDEAVPQVRLVKGSHIIIRKLFDGDHAYILQQPDKRIVFAIPYEHDYTLIGTTDVDYDGDPAAPRIDTAEIEYLCAAINRSFEKQITPDEVEWAYSGVRTLVAEDGENASSTTRDYKLLLDTRYGPPIISAFGGKITTYRYLAEEAVDQLSTAPTWTADEPLPGGDMDDFEDFLARQLEQYDMLPPALINRCAHAYGTRMDSFLAGGDLGIDFGDNIFEAEIRYLIEQEWAQNAEDILWRRSKLGLHISPQTAQKIGDYISAYFASPSRQAPQL